MKIVLPLSGGMDSAVLLYKAVAIAEEIHCINFDYGQRHIRELECAIHLFEDAKKRSGKKMKMHFIDATFIKKIAPVSSLTNESIDTPDVRKIAGEAQPASYVPFRNLMFLSIALSLAESVGATEVWHGATAIDSLAGYWDASPEFIPALNTLCDLNREHRISIVSPLIEMDKADIVRLGVSLGVPFEHTYTCYTGQELADANSASSSLRLKGFIDAGYRDPIKYKQQKFLDEIYEKQGCVECYQR